MTKKRKATMNWDKLADSLLRASQCKNVYSSEVRDIFKELAISIDYATDRYVNMPTNNRS